MTREEVLTRLREIKDAIDNDTAIKKTDDGRERERAIDALNLEIRSLQEKLSNDENYVSTDYLENQEKIREVNEQITALNEELADNEARIRSIENGIANVDAELDKRKASLVEERKISTYDSETNTAVIYPRIDELTHEIEFFEEIRKGFVEQLEVLTKRKEQLENQLPIYREQLAIYEKKSEKYASGNTDEEKKSEDRRRIELLTKRIEYLKNPNIMVDFSTELTQLIEDYGAGFLTEKGVEAKLVVLSSKYPTKDEETVNKELVAVGQLSDELSVEIIALEEKIADEINYTPSRLRRDSLMKEISDLQREYNNYDIAIPALVTSIANQQRNKDYADEAIEDCKKEISTLEDENRLLGIRIGTENLTQKEIEHIVKKINDNKRLIKKIDTKMEKYRKTSNSLANSIKSMEADKKNFESLKQQVSKKIEEKQNLLEDTVHIDSVELEKDKKMLDNLKEEMSVLLGIASAIKFDYSSKIEDLRKDIALGVKPVVEESLVEEVAPTDISEVEDEFEPVVAPIPTDLLGIEPTEEVIETPEDEVQIETVSAPIPTELPGIESEDEVVPVPITGWKKAKKSLIDKIKDKKFVKKAIIGVAALATMLALLTAGCQKRNDDVANQIVYEEAIDSYDGLYGKLPELEDVKPDIIPEQPVINENKPVNKPVSKPVVTPSTPKTPVVEDIKPVTPEVITPSDIPSVDDVKPDSPIEEETDKKKPSKNDKENNKKPSSDDDKPSKDDEIDKEEPIVPPVVEGMEKVEQEIVDGSVGVIVTGTSEEPTITVTDNAAPDYIKDAALELAEKHAQAIEEATSVKPEIKDPFEDNNVTSLTYDQDSTINLEANTQSTISTTLPTLEDTVEEMAEVQYGTSYDELESLFADFNNSALDELEQGGKSR